MLFYFTFQVAEDCNLVVIPLVQTFGHLEYVLKYFTHLREHPGRPDCLLPIESFGDDSFDTVTQLIDDVVNISPNCPAIHLGGDEVYIHQINLGHTEIAGLEQVVAFLFQNLFKGREKAFFQ